MKTYQIKKIRTRDGKETVAEGTLPELINYFSYTLEVGKSWEHEKGNKKIDRNPKSVASLVKNLHNAKNNAARNGWGGELYEVI